MAADVYTKGFTNAPKWDAAISLIGIYTLSDRTKLNIRYRKCLDRSGVSALSAVTSDCVPSLHIVSSATDTSLIPKSVCEHTIRPHMSWHSLPPIIPDVAMDRRTMIWWRNASFEDRADEFITYRLRTALRIVGKEDLIATASIGDPSPS